MQLLFWCCRLDNRDSNRSFAEQLLCRGLDWDLLLRQARLHTVDQLLYWNLTGWADHLIPELYRNQLRDTFALRAAGSEDLCDELVGLIGRAEQQGICVLCLKGPVLAFQACRGEPGLRQPGDLDLLVKTDQVLPMMRFLQEEGFEPGVIESKVAADWETIARPEIKILGPELTFTHPVSGTVVDLHWRLTHDTLLRVDENVLWANTQSVPLREFQLRTLEPHLNFAYLCVHAAKHGWFRLRCLADLIGLIESGIDLLELLSRCESWQCKRLVTFALGLVLQCPGVALPDSVRTRIEKDAGLTREINFVAEVLGTGRQLTDVEKRLSMVRLQDNAIACLKLYLHGLFTPTLRDWESVKLTPDLFWLFVFLRPLRLLRDYSAAYMRSVVTRLQNPKG